MDICGDNQPQQTTHMITQDLTISTTRPRETTTRLYSSPTAAPVTTSPISSTQTIRLVNGLSNREGRVEIFHNGQWGTVCDDGFGSKEASVVCHMLGYSREAAVAWQQAHFGQGVGNIWLDDVKCLGNETDILWCAHLLSGANNCAHSEDVGVTCDRQSCPSGWQSFQGSCYFIGLKKIPSLTFDAAQAKCESLNPSSSLVALESIEETNFIKQYLQQHYSPILPNDDSDWMTSGYRVNGEWTWKTTGAPINTTAFHWGVGRPNGQSCLSFYAPYQFDMLDVGCYKLPYRQIVCEFLSSTQ